MNQATVIWVERDDAVPTKFQSDHFEIAMLSRPDPEKDVSEDALFVVPLDDESVCVGVIDGMGGMAAGGKAARITAEVIAARLEARLEGTALSTALVEGFEHAHAKVIEACSGGGATAVAAIVTSDTIQFIHSGDAEGLHLSEDGHLKHRTPAHSPVGHAQQMGVLSELEGLLHPERHLVSNAVGIEGMTIEIGPILPMSPSDTVVLCSDGLTDNVFEEEILQGLRSGPLDQAVHLIAALATQRMHDPLQIPTGHTISKRDDMTILAVRRKRSTSLRNAVDMTP